MCMIATDCWEIFWRRLERRTAMGGPTHGLPWADGMWSALITGWLIKEDFSQGLKPKRSAHFGVVAYGGINSYVSIAMIIHVNPIVVIRILGTQEIARVQFQLAVFLGWWLLCIEMMVYGPWKIAGLVAPGYVFFQRGLLPIFSEGRLSMLVPRSA